MLEEIKQAGRYMGQAMRAMVGIPEYSAYLDHMEKTHPEQPVMTYEEFFRERQEARYGGKGRIGRCC
ncbi:putative selenoprotein [Herbaspirillum sp. HC18]|nr:putative selenoprotein [Herbaspirillum sp. HC18]